MDTQNIYRIGTGAGFSSDRLEPALDLLRLGRLDAIVFECVGERTLAFGHRDRRADPARGYNPLLERRMRAVLPLAQAAGIEAGADVIITGRVADPSLFLAPMAHHFSWGLDDWRTLGAGTSVGHLLECAAQVTGGYFADPGHKEVPDLAYVGFPLAEVTADGSAIITKLESSGGLVSQRTVKEQLLYEVHDPAAYLTPDVSANFSQVQLSDDGKDRVRVNRAGGAPRPAQLKVTVAFDGGFLAEAEISYAGPGAAGRAGLAGSVVSERMDTLHGSNGQTRIDLIGVSALHASAVDYPDMAQDVRLRCAMRASSMDAAELLLWEVEALLCCGPAAGGGYRGHVTPSVITYSAFVDRGDVRPQLEILST